MHPSMSKFNKLTRMLNHDAFLIGMIIYSIYLGTLISCVKKIRITDILISVKNDKGSDSTRMKVSLPGESQNSEHP